MCVCVCTWARAYTSQIHILNGVLVTSVINKRFGFVSFTVANWVLQELKLPLSSHIKDFP